MGWGGMGWDEREGEGERRVAVSCGIQWYVCMYVCMYVHVQVYVLYDFFKISIEDQLLFVLRNCQLMALCNMSWLVAASSCLTRDITAPYPRTEV